MKILIILKSVFPYPLSSGGQQAVFHMIDYLKDKIDISIVYDAKGVNPSDEKKLISLWENVKFFRYSKSKYDYIGWNYIFINKLCKKIQNILFHKEKDYTLSQVLTIHNEYDNDFLEFINSIIKQEKIEIVQTEFLDSISLVYALPENVKKVFVQHEIGYIRNALLLKEMKSDQMIDKYHFEKLKSFEVSTMNQYNVIITLTDVDSMKLKNDNVITAIMSSPACIPVKTKHSNYTYTTNRLTFLGGYNHKPNSDGLKWFLEKVWSFILITKPDTVLDVVGSWPKDVCEELMKRYKNITFKGMIQDLATVLPGSVMIVPILVGSGMRMKILDAVNHGCPFVTTTVGVEGLNFVNNESCFVEDVSESFASKVLELLNNKELQELFLLNSQKVYNENYSIEILGDKRLQIYNDLYSQKIHSNNTGME